jgi:hypothetical protein
MRSPALALAVAVLLSAQRTSAQERVDDVEPAYVVDGGAVPLLWLPLAGSLALDRWVSPRQPPLGFDPDEGGLPSQRDDEVPGLVVTAGAAGVGLALIVHADESRWFHLKGFAEAIATTSFVTEATKRIFGRRRPDYDDADDADDRRLSFPSGHSSQAAATLTYGALYLHAHVFDEDAGWAAVATYVGLGALALAVPAERVVRHRHHVTDVVAGVLLGAATSIALFAWQEHRYEAAR